MAIPVKAILLEKNDTSGNGLTTVRQKESKAIDISEYVDGLGDPTASTTRGNIVYKNKVYTILRTYIDLDKKCRYVLARCEGNSFDRWPVM